MSLYKLLEYSDNYADSSGSLWQLKRDEQNVTDVGNPDSVTTDDLSYFKYRSSLLKDLNSRNIAANVNPNTADAHRLFTNAKIVVLLKYLSNIFRSLEMPLINYKIHLELTWTKHFVMSSTVGATEFQIKSTKNCVF